MNATAERVTRVGDIQVTGEVQITNINVPFWDLVRLMVKIALAALPAALIVWMIYGAAIAIIAAIGVSTVANSP